MSIDPLAESGARPFVAPLVLLSAILNAAWNAILKRRLAPGGGGDGAGAPGDRILATLGWVMGVGGLVAILAVPLVVAPRPAIWPFLAISAVLQTVHALLLAAAYQRGDLSFAYP
jgi:hypothetical protein